jgi:hypothetical protein
MSPGWKSVLVAVALASGGAMAGQTCEPARLDATKVAMSMSLAQRTAKRLDETGARVVMLARAGQDLGAYGVRWSHMGFAYQDGEAGSPWRVVHKLNDCGSTTSAVYRQGLGEFFLDDPYRYEAAIVALSPEAQARLLPVLRDDARAIRWHAAEYNMLAYPWATRYQQSNQWALETLAGAMLGNEAGRVRTQAWLRAQGYKPATLHLDAMTRLGARMTRANIAFDDHPSEKRFAGRIETVTVDSAFAWLKTSGFGEEVVEVR